MKKKLLLLGTGICLTFCTLLHAQQDPYTKEFYGTCGTKAPSEESEQAFQKQIEEYKQAKARGVQVSYEIPVIVHILYKQGLAVGSSANIAAAQVKAQLDALNDCMAGITPGNSSLPTPFAQVDANDIAIHFCLATKGPDGKTLPEAGIDRINFTAKNWTDPASLDANSISNYFDQTIKPGSIWDPKKYFNIWVGDFFDPAKGGLLGYATFPVGTGLSGLTSNLETATTSGVVMGTRVFGCKAKYANGYYASESYIYGITTAHEVGHYLGLRHIGGDTPCGNDFCNDTPPQKGGYQNGPNGQNWGCPSYPFQANGCSGNSNGEMFQNYMDYTTDACRSLFTQDQEDRMMTSMANGTYRKAFGTHGLCSQGPSAVFSADKTSICEGAAVTFTDKSGSSPNSWKWTFTGGTPSTSTKQNPTVTYPTAGTYDVKLVVSNSLGADSIVQTKYITVNPASPAPTVTGGKRCGPGIVNLSATGSSTLEWYDAATGGNKVNTGTTYSPNLNTTTTYYVGQPGTGTIQKVGPADKSIGSGGYFTNTDRVTYFNVLQPLTIKTVKIDANTAGDRTIEIFDANKTSVAKKTVTLTAGLNTSTLDIALNTGNGYYIKLADGSAADLYRNNAGAVFPYTLSGIISITGTDAASNGGSDSYYYYFYDWEISTTSCPGLRAPVTGTINPAPAKPTITAGSNGTDLTASSGTSYQWFLNGTLIPGATSQTYSVKEKGSYTVIITDANGCSATSDPFIVTGISTLENQVSFDVFPNPNNGSFTFNLTVIEKDNFQIQLKNILGQVLYSENLNGFKGNYNKQFDLSVFGKGVYTLTVMNAKGQQVKKIIVE
jgi:zinc-dependent metalloproteinase lipoprotein